MVYGNVVCVVAIALNIYISSIISALKMFIMAVTLTIFCDCILYVDDILLSGSVVPLRKMLKKLPAK